MDEKTVKSDSMTELGSVVHFGLCNWDGSVRVHWSQVWKPQPPSG